MPGIRTSVLSLRAIGSTKVIKAVTQDSGGSDVGQLPYSYIKALCEAGGQGD